MRNAKRNGEERRKVRKQLEVKLEKLKQGTSIREIEDAISNHVRTISQKMTSYLQSDEVSSRFCRWDEKDLPHISDCQGTNVTGIKETYSRCIKERFHSFLQNWENREKLFAKAHADLEELFHQSFYDFEKDIREIDSVFLGDARDDFTCQASPTSPSHRNMEKTLVMTLGIFMPVLMPVGLAAGVLSAPAAFGNLAIDKHLQKSHLKKNRCQALEELSTACLQVFIKDQVFDDVLHKFSEETNRIARVKRRQQELVTIYEQRCTDLTRIEDDSRDKETLKKNGPLYDQLQEMNEKLMFDAIEDGMQVMNPPCQIDIRRLCYKETDIVGGGSYGTIFKGQFTPPGHGTKDVAVKKLREAPCPSNLLSFLQEAATTK